ncbi:MAG: CatB-related O-acetyltransferase [Rhodococcus sp. (in: high G+C Gram-positive bacteria)]|uniref:CatB-related O-acetyltransferase n=1 Tax=Rhodococcus sp. TaxID=1831 RepID=UPI002AD912E8|nr:CatB-related O-acetyltransferase [Rhodococcus sp. (in: high G+C Gram-positive bacteria)]
MNRTVVSRIIAKCYKRVPFGGRAIALATRLEGGQMFSVTLREVLQRDYGVKVGAYSYGSLLQPGWADVATVIGRYVSIGPGVRRIGAAHPLDKVSMHPFWYNPRLGMVGQDSDVERTGCVIDHDCWIGANTLILPSCRRIGIGAVVGAGSVVTHDIPDFAIAVGNPARVVRQRFEPADARRIMDSRYWELEPAGVKELLASSPLGKPTFG